MIKAVILAGGKSERIRPLEEKPLLKMIGKRLIVHQIELLYSAGVRNFLIIGNEVNVKVLQNESFEWGKEFSGAEFDFATQQFDLGSAGALLSATEKLIGWPILLVSANDILSGDAYSQVVEQIKSAPNIGCLLAKKVEKYFPGGYLMVDNELNLQNIIEKPEPGKEPSDLMNIVVHYLPSGELLMKEIYQNQSHFSGDLYQFSLLKMIGKGLRMQVLPYAGKWQAVKYPWHIFDEAAVLFEKEWKAVDGLAGNDSMMTDFSRKKLLVDESVVLGKQTTLNGPVYLGENCQIGEGAEISNCFIENGCVIGAGSRLKDCYLGENSRIGANSSLSGVIAAAGVQIGENCTFIDQLANSENIKITIKGNVIDTERKKLGAIIGEQVKIENNCQFAPGIRIAKGKVIESNTKVSEDLN